MNKRELTRAALFASSHKGNTQLRGDSSCAFCCVLPARVRTFVLALMITALTVMASPFVTEAGAAHAYISEDKTTAVVADFDELKKAVEGSDGYANVEQIIIDPQAAVDFADKKDADIEYGDGAFYIPIEQPIRISREVTITTAEDVQVILARSAKGGNGDYDSKDFSGANEEWPAFFNLITPRAGLTIEGNITMSGDVVAADFNEEKASFTFDVEEKEWSRGNGTGIVDGGFFVHSSNGGSVVINGASNSDEKATENVVFTNFVTDTTVINAAPIYVGGGSTLEMNGGSITGNDVGFSDEESNTAGAIMIKDKKTSVELNDGEIAGNRGYAGDILADEESVVNVSDKFIVADNTSFEKKDAEASDNTEDAKATEESKDAAPQETTAAPKRLMKNAAPALRNGGNTPPSSIVVVDGTTTVSTTRQLKEALATPGVTTIIIDETGAFSEVGITDESGNKNVAIEKTNSNLDKKFYLPVDEPLTMVTNDDGNRTITIKSKDEKEVVIARSNLFGNKATSETPAIFNVPSGVTLNLSSKITMSGDTVTSAYKYKDDEGNELDESGYSPGQEAFDSGVFVLGTDSYFGITQKLGGGAQHEDYLGSVSGADAKELSLDSNGFIILTHKNQSCHLSKEGKVIEGAPSVISGDWRLKALDKDGNPMDGYVTQLTAGTNYVITSGVDFYKRDLYVKFDGTNFTRDANFGGSLQFKAAKSVEDATATGDQEYEGIKFKFNVEPATRDKNEVKAGGYFIHAADGGKVTLNSGVSLQDLNTTADVKDAAPVVIEGGSRLTINGATISNNTVGYAANEADSNGKSIQYIQNKLEKTDMTNTAGGVILKGSDTVGEFTSGEISGNKADAGAVIVTDGALVTMEDNFDILNNIGYHHAGAAQVERGGRFIMNGGEMSGNVAWYKGGAVWATQWGTNGYANINWKPWPKEFPVLTNPKGQGADGVFVMNGGTLSNNTAFARGGAIEVESNGVVLNNGTIEGNKCRSLGGAIYVEGDAQSYSYTLKINNGYIGNNRSVTHEKGSESSSEQYKVDNYTLNSYLKDGVLTGGGDDSWDNSFNGAMGNGGGVWLCPVGGSSVFADDKVLIDNNTAKRTGTDFYLHKGNGAMIVQNIAGTWVDERTNPATEVNFDQEKGSVLNGPAALRNDQKPEYTEGQSAITDSETGKTKNVVIKNNISRDGGGIAANGTLVFGSTNDVDRYDARINITKEWIGITPTNVKFEIGYLDSNNKFVPLRDGTVAEQPVNYEFELDGNADTPTGSDTESPAFGGSAVGEVEKESDTKWKASAFIPASVTLSDGTIYPLYEFVNPYSDGPRTLSPAIQSHLKTIRKIIKDENQSLVIAEKSWKLKIREIDANFNVTIRDIEVDNSKTQAPFTRVPMYDPVTGKDTGAGFTVYFSTVELDQTIINEGKGIEFTKLASNTNQALEETEFYITEATLGNYWYVPGTRPGNPDNGTLEGSVISEKALNKEPLKPNASGKVEILNGKLKTGKRLTVPGNYFLFETKTAEGYKRKTSPWLVQIDNLGHVTIKEVAAAYQGESIGGNSAEQDFSGTTVDGYDTDSVFKTWWKNEWFTENTNGKLMNDVEVKLNKVGPGGEAFNGTATFELYEIQTDKTADGKNTYCYTDSYKVAEVDTKNGVLDLTPYMKDATNDPGNTGNPYPFTKDKYFILKEKATSNSKYAVQSAPWLVIVKTDATVELKVYEDVNATPIVKGPYLSGTWYHWERGKFKTDSLTQAGKLENNYKTFKLTKTNENGSTPLGGAVFALNDVAYHTGGYLYSTDAGRVAKDGKIYTVTSDSETGIIDLTEGIELAISQNKGKDPSLSNAAVTEYTSGKRVLMLYEITRPDGYKRAKAPWLLFIDDATREVTVREYSDRYADHTKMGNNGHKYWQASKFIERTITDGKLRNKPVDLEITKTDGLLSTTDKDVTLEGVKFDIYHAEERTINKPNGDFDHNEYHIDPKRPNKINTEDIVTNSLGKFTLPITETGIYLLYEVGPIDGYSKPVAPWGIKLNEDGVLEVYKIKDDEQVLKEYVKRYKEASDDKLIHLDCRDLDKLVEYKIENNPQLIKKDKKTEQPLAGAKFDIYHVEISKWYSDPTYYVQGSKLNSSYLVSDENGRIDLSDTDKIAMTGDKTYFFLWEKVAPAGYEDTKPTLPWLLIRDNNTWKFTIREIHTQYSHSYAEGSSEYNDIMAGTTGMCDAWFRTETEEYVFNTTNKVILHKKDSISKKGLKGVKFNVYIGSVSDTSVSINTQYGTNGFLTSVETGNNGAIVLKNLPTSVVQNGGLLTLLFFETETLSDYVRPSVPFIVQLRKENNDYKLAGVYHCNNPEKYQDNYITLDPNDYDDGNTTGDLYNSKAYELPSAGGMGTYWFMMFGAMMMAFAAALPLAMRSRRFGKNN